MGVSQTDSGFAPSERPGMTKMLGDAGARRTFRHRPPCLGLSDASRHALFVPGWPHLGHSGAGAASSRRNPESVCLQARCQRVVTDPPIGKFGPNRFRVRPFGSPRNDYEEQAGM